MSTRSTLRDEHTDFRRHRALQPKDPQRVPCGPLSRIPLMKGYHATFADPVDFSVVSLLVIAFWLRVGVLTLDDYSPGWTMEFPYSGAEVLDCSTALQTFFFQELNVVESCF